MVKKVLVISASPRRNGNSDMLCDEFIKGAVESGATVEKVFTADKKIGFCKGCGVCNNTHKCIINDDMSEILDKMVESDVIVMATPIYFYTMNGQLKTIIDRVVPRYQEISNKDFYLIMAAADTQKSTLDRTVHEFGGFLDCLNNPKLKGTVYGVGAWNVGEIKGQPSMKEAYEMGKNI